MATPVDLEFLRLAVQHAVFDRATAEKCLEIMDVGAKRGKALSASQVAINLGLVDARKADALAAMARSATAASATVAHGDEKGAFAIVGFKLEKKLGRGPCGATYDAKRVAPDGTEGWHVALKVLTQRFAQHPRTLAAILDEARRGKDLDHENVVTLREVIASSGRDVLVFDRARGRSLAAELEAGPIPTLRATEIAIGIAKALAAAHARGLAHGDVRPAKVLVDGDVVKLADFGLAHAACLAAGYGQAGLPFGHPEYLAPEVVQERLPRPTPRSDIYALGITLYELCCGRVPHQGRTHRETLRRHFESPLPPPPDEVHLSAALAEVILRLTAKDPARRPADMKATLQVLEDYRRKRLAGQTSDVGSTAGGSEEQTISKDDWSKKSAGANERSGEWTSQKIDSAERVGPAEFTGDRDEDESFEHGTVPSAKAVGVTAAPAKRKGCGLFLIGLLVLLALRAAS